MRIRTLAVVMAAGILGSGARSYALPVFARQTGAPCSLCHAPVPKLTKVGYEFRAAGFRMPSDIGKTSDKPMTWTDFMSMRGIISARSTKNPGATSVTDVESNGVEAYPLTGPYKGNWGAETEIDFELSSNTGSLNSLGTSLGCAYLKYVGGSADSFWTIRGGALRTVEGYGATDRSIGLTSPLIRGTRPVAAGLASPFAITLGGNGEGGLELGYSYHDTRLTASVLNGLDTAGHPAQSRSVDNHKDYQLLLNQMIGNSGGAISGYYYNGSDPLGATGPRDHFNRWGVFGSAPVLPLPAGALEIYGGYGGGRDSTTTTLHSKGFFAEVRAPLTKKDLWAYARYDQADPASSVSHNNLTAATFGLNLLAEQNILLQAEFQHRWNQRGPGVDGSAQGNALGARASLNF